MKLSAHVLCFFVIMLLFNETHCQRTQLDSLKPLYRMLRGLTFNLLRSRDEPAAYQANLAAGKVQPRIDPNVPFFCDVNGPGGRSEKVPSSVHKLRPGDIDIVGSLGDSITAGNGVMALNLPQVSVENRGVTFTGGQGDWRKFLTIPNILKEFNPNVYGYSTKDSLSIEKSSMFNVAEFGAMSKDIPYMSSILIQRIKSDPKVDFKNHWKLITLLIGPNDFCLDICYRDKPESVLEAHKRDLLAGFRNIRDNMPRTMINIVPSPSLKVLVEFTGKPNVCVITNNFECPCMFAAKYLHNRQVYYKLMEEWKQIAFDVANQEEFQNLQDFTINVQPFLTKVEFPKTRYNITDYRYLSTDCFHISQIGHARISNALWNNMLEPVGQKAFNWKKEFQELKCPTHQRPYLATRFNS